MMFLQNVATFKWLFVPLAAVMWFAGPLAAEEEVPDPEQLVKTVVNETRKALKENQQELQHNPAKIYSLVDDLLLPHFDFKKMSKLVLGKNWRQAANAEQRELFVEEFRLLLVRTYSTALLEYTDNAIKFLPFRGDISKKRANIVMEVEQASGPAVPMAMSMFLNKGNEWKVYDVKIDGVSLVTNYRSSFAEQIRKEGMDKLIESLAKRNQKAKK